MLENNIELYKELMSEVNEENVEFAGVYVKTKHELITKFKEWAEEEDREDIVESFQNRELDIRFKGEGYYDVWGYSFSSDLIIARIDEILDAEVDNIEIHIDPSSVVNEIKENQEYKLIYCVFGIKHQGESNTVLEYVVKSNVKLKEHDIYEFLEENGIEPYAWGCGTGKTDKFYNFYIAELEDLDSDDLQKYISSDNYEIFKFDTEFDNIIGFSQATEMWKLADSTLRKAVQNGKFREGIDCKKVGRDWITTIEIMEREYGDKGVVVVLISDIKKRLDERAIKYSIMGEEPNRIELKISKEDFELLENELDSFDWYEYEDGILSVMTKEN